MNIWILPDGLNYRFITEKITEIFITCFYISCQSEMGMFNKDLILMGNTSESQNSMKENVTTSNSSDPLPPPQFFFSDTLLFIFFLITWLILHMLDFICHSRLFPFILHHMYLHVDDWNHTSLILCWLKLYRCEINKITKSHNGKQNPVSVWLISFLCAILSFAQDTI